MIRTAAGLGLALLLAGCAADRPPPVEARAPAYCPNPPAVPVNAQGLVLPPPILRDNAVDWESTYAYRLEFSLASPRTLAGKGPETARDLAWLAMVGNSFDRNLRFQTLAAQGTLMVRTGVWSMRQWLGVAPEVLTPQLVGALLATECALWGADRAAARTALAKVAGAPDALDRVAPADGRSPPPVPREVAAAAAIAAKAIRSQGMTDGPFIRLGRAGF
ncbi:MAG: hypothetical protein IT556_04460 [Acetobacteraceae bacterium]|nr:hypothetical protein [Acetobacteraceae bacterium]